MHSFRMGTGGKVNAMKNFGLSLSRLSVDWPKAVTVLILVPTVVLALLAALPSLLPRQLPWLNPVQVDTDPENMLAADAPVRVLHDTMKEQFALHDMVVVGVVNRTHPEGVFNRDSLTRIYTLTEFAKTLQWPDPEDPDRRIGVVPHEIIAPSTVDNIESGGLGVVRFEWLMNEPPQTQEDALAVRDKALNIPFLNGTLVSEDGQAIALYLPLTSKSLSHRVYSALNEKIATFDGDDEFHITGLPVAEDTFGVEMFKQMAISAPLAMLAIFILMLLFFRKLMFIVSPLIIAMISVILTMSLLIVTGQTIHIMSSMIPIFIMPIAVLDSVHILSMFFDRFQATRDVRGTMLDVMDSLFMPMLYTSLTSAAGFASLALAPIPPVQVFGLFCAFGIMTAWLLTVTFIPAFVAFIPATRLASLGSHSRNEAPAGGLLSRILSAGGRLTYRGAVPILGITVAGMALAIYGIFQIRVNDNPIKWFESRHPIRVADQVLNSHFGGTYMAYLALRAEDLPEDIAVFSTHLTNTITDQLTGNDAAGPRAIVTDELIQRLEQLRQTVDSPADLLARLQEFAEERTMAEEDDDLYDAWDDAALMLQREQQRTETFKQPDVLRYLDTVTDHLRTVPQVHNPAETVVGKSNSLTDIVKTVYRELRDGRPEQYTVPETPAAVAQCLIQYQSSHRPQDLWHFVTPDYRNTSIWFQLRTGDNIEMIAVADALDAFLEQHPPPVPMNINWFGLTYINVVWQEEMVYGMLFAFLGSFLVVFLMMTLLFRSALWGLLCMIPLTVTIAFIYGAIGLIGKDYDMPVAVLSALALGLAVDFAIHFLEHSRVHRLKSGSWEKTAAHVFGDPARAIVRNIIVIAVGFLPLLAAPLVPYQTVGVFLASILAVSGIATLLILPALVRLLERFLFPESRLCCVTCNCITCIVAGVALVVLVAINVNQFLHVGWTVMTWWSLAAIVVLTATCKIMSYREKCRRERQRRTAD